MSMSRPTNKHLRGHLAVYTSIVFAATISASIAFVTGDSLLLLVNGGIIATVLVVAWYEFGLK